MCIAGQMKKPYLCSQNHLWNIFMKYKYCLVFIAFALIWTMGFIGGTFESYILSSLPEGLKHLMPIYHSNRALVELSSMGKSDYVVSAIAYHACLAAVCSCIAVGTAGIKRRVR